MDNSVYVVWRRFAVLRGGYPTTLNMHVFSLFDNSLLEKWWATVVHRSLSPRRWSSWSKAALSPWGAWEPQGILQRVQMSSLSFHGPLRFHRVARWAEAPGVCFFCALPRPLWMPVSVLWAAEGGGPGGVMLGGGYSFHGHRCGPNSLAIATLALLQLWQWPLRGALHWGFSFLSSLCSHVSPKVHPTLSGIQSAATGSSHGGSVISEQISGVPALEKRRAVDSTSGSAAAGPLHCGMPRCAGGCTCPACLVDWQVG